MRPRFVAQICKMQSTGMRVGDTLNASVALMRERSMKKNRMHLHEFTTCPIQFVSWAACASSLCACASISPVTNPTATASNTGVASSAAAATASGTNAIVDKQASALAATPVVVRPPALWDGSAVTWEELRPLLAERAGASILEELFLERQLDRMVTARSKMVSQELLDAEERELVASLSDDPTRAMVLLNELRAAQGLGEKRWKSLLKRNAAMRLLVQDDVKVTPDAIEAVIDAQHGARRQCRVMALSNLDSCAKARMRLDAGEPFGEVAADMSTDRSAARGGLVLPVSRLDPSWPSSFRQTLWSLQKGKVSSPVLIDNGYVFIRFEDEIAGDPEKAMQAKSGAERAVRRGQERILMENLAKQLRQAQRNVTIFDDSILDVWTRVKNAAR